MADSAPRRFLDTEFSVHSIGLDLLLKISPGPISRVQPNPPTEVVLQLPRISWQALIEFVQEHLDD